MGGTCSTFKREAQSTKTSFKLLAMVISRKVTPMIPSRRQVQTPALCPRVEGSSEDGTEHCTYSRTVLMFNQQSDRLGSQVYLDPEGMFANDLQVYFLMCCGVDSEPMIPQVYQKSFVDQL